MDEVIKAAIEDALKTLGLPEADFSLEHPDNLAFGDFACNVAMVAFKGRRSFEKAVEGNSSTINVKYGLEVTNPRALAEAIKEILEKEDYKIEWIEKIEIAGPGFLNFYLARDFFAEEIARINELKEAWGRNHAYEGTEIMLEYTSPNLFKPLHVGNLVGNIVGESLARLFEFSGGKVHRINYPSDIGLTVAKGVWGLQKTGGDPKDINALGEAYKIGNEGYENDPTAKEEIEAVNRALYAHSDAALDLLRSQGITTSKARLAELCRMLGTTFDAEIFESEASVIGKEIVERHTGDIFEKSDGAVVYKGEQDGLHTRVFLNSQGLPTYEAKDLGNMQIKQQLYPNWSISVIVTGNEQAEYFKVLYAAMRKVFALDPEKELVHIPTGFLTLTTGKMSSRKGNVLTGESILEELQEESRSKAATSRTDNVEKLAQQVAVAALKYQILKHTLGSSIVFDKEKALSFEGDSGPYLQYTFARISSVLQKAEAAKITASYASLPETAYDLEKVLYRFDEVVVRAMDECAPHMLVVYLTELAGMFNTFYAHEQIVDAQDPITPYKIAIAKAIQITLKNGLQLLGMEAPDKM